MVKVSAPSLEITFAGKEFKSPIGVGAVGRPFGKNVTPEMHAEFLLKHAEAGAGYIEIPTCIYATEETIRKVEANAKPVKKPSSIPPPGVRFRKAETRASPYGVEGVYTLGYPGWTDPVWGKERGRDTEELTRIVKKRRPKDVRIIANTLGYGVLPDSWVDSAKRWEELGADLIELNYSCPGPPTVRNAVEDFLEKKFPARWLGGVLSELPDVMVNITKEVAKAVSIPVGVKLSPEIGFLRVIEVARRVRDAGAKWVQSVNMAITIAPPDIYNRPATPTMITHGGNSPFNVLIWSVPSPSIDAKFEVFNIRNSSPNLTLKIL